MASDPQELVDQAMELHGNGQAQEALSRVNAALKLDSSHGQAWYLRGIILAEHQKIEKAVEAYRNSAKCSPDQAHLSLYNMGVVYQESGDEQRALKCFTRATEVAPDMADAWLNQGRLLDDSGQHREAIECYDRALEHEPDDPMTWSNRGNSLRAMHRFADAVESYQKALTMDPQDLAAFVGVAACSGKLGDPQSGLEMLEQIPDFESVPVLLLEHAVLLAQAERWADALKSINRAIEAGLKTPQSWNNRGEMLSRLNKAKSALQSFNEALQLDKTYAPAWFGKARLLFYHRRYEEALRCIHHYFEFATEDDPLAGAAQVLKDACANPPSDGGSDRESAHRPDRAGEPAPVPAEGPSQDEPVVTPVRQLPTTQCECCQRDVFEYFGTLQHKNRDIAAYWLHLPTAHPGLFYMAILRQASKNSEKLIIVLGGESNEQGVTFNIADPDESPWTDLKVGRILTRQEGLETDDRDAYFRLADAITLQDPHLLAFLA